MNSRSTRDWWTAEREILLRAGYRESTGIDKIAAELGTTRNAVAGRAKRLGLVHPRVRAPKPPGIRVARPRKAGRRVALPRRPRVVRVPVDAGPEPAARFSTLIETLEACGCKWPSGTVWCGNQKLGSGPYCLHHSLRASVQQGRHT